MKVCRSVMSVEERRLRNAASAKRWRLKDPEKARRIRRESEARAGSKVVEARRERARQFRAKNPAKAKQYWTEWQEKNPEKNILCRIRGRAKRQGAAFGMVPSDITFPNRCPVLGIPMNYTDVYSDGYPQVDRIIPSCGYVSGNVRVISDRKST